MKDSSIWGSDGKVTLSVTNGSDSTMKVELRLSGEGLEFPQGSTMTVKLKPGDNDITVAVVGTSKARELIASMTVGEHSSWESRRPPCTSSPSPTSSRGPCPRCS